MSQRSLKKAFVKKVEREGPAIVLLGPPGKNGLLVEKRVRLHCVRFADDWLDEACYFLRQRLVGSGVEFDDYALDDFVAADVFVEGKCLNAEVLLRGYGHCVKTVKPSKFYPELCEAAKAAEDAQKGVYGERPRNPKPPVALSQLIGIVVHVWVEEFTFELNLRMHIEELGGCLEAAFLGVTIPVVSKEHVTSFRNWASKNALQRSFEAKLVSEEGGRVRMISIHPTESVIGQMLKLGWARLESDASAKLSSGEFIPLRELQEQGMAAKSGIWKDFQGKLPQRAGNDARFSSEFEGRVTEVHSGDSFSLQRGEGEPPLRIFLSHLRAPAMGGREEEPRPWAWEAREHLRRSLIGRKVRVRVDNVRKVEKEGKDTLELVHATVYTEEGGCVGEELLDAGLASFQSPRTDDPASAALKELMAAAERAQKAHKGIHGKQTPRRSVWDLSLPENRRKTKELGLEAYRGKEGQSGVVEYLFSATRFKLRFERENCLFLLSLNFAKVLEADPNAPNRAKWAQTALEFARNRLTQRDVTFEVEAIDKGGVVHGRLWIGKKDFATELLTRGLAHVVPGPRRGSRVDDYTKLEAAARERGVGFWGEGIRPNSEEDHNEPKEFVCRCSEFVGLHRFFLRRFEEGEALDSRIASLKSLIPAVEPLHPNTLLLGRYDGAFYRCRLVRKGENGYQVNFVDYGNTECLKLADLRQLPSALAEQPPLAFAATLDYLRFPPQQAGFDQKVTDFLESLLEGDRLIAVVNRRAGGVSFCVVGRVSGLANSFNLQILRKGLAGLDSTAPDEQVLNEAARQGAEANPELAAILANFDDS